MALKPLDSDDQHYALRRYVERYREQLALAEEARKGYIQAETAWKDTLARCESLKEELAKYVDKKNWHIIVTLDGGNTACSIRFVDSLCIDVAAQVTFLPVSGYLAGPDKKDEIGDR